MKRLINRYDEARAKRLKKEEEERPIKEQIDAIIEAPRFSTIDFWCNKCKKDCSGTAYRQIRTLPHRLPIAWYMGFCPKGHKLIRRITDKLCDPYYFQSIMIKRQRMEYADLLLTPDNPKFKEIYPEQYKELMKKQ